MEAKIKEAWGLMQYRRFWSRDHERNCDVVCVDFKPTNAGPAGDNSQASAELAKRTADTREFVDFLRAHGINSYIHYGPTGAIFAAIVCSDESKRILGRL